MRKNYETQSGDRFNDFRTSPKVLVRGQAFRCAAGWDRSAVRRPLALTDLAFLPVVIRAGCLDFPANEAVAFGSCRSRLAILVSTGATLGGAGEVNGTVGRNAISAGISGRARANSSRSALVNGS